MSFPFTESEIEQIVQNVLRQIPHASVPVADLVQGTQQTVLNERVITAETLQNLGLSQATIQVSAGAIMTPSARDYVKQHQLVIASTSTGVDIKQAGQKSAGNSLLLLETQANTSVRSALQAAAKQAGGNWQKQLSSDLNEMVATANSEVHRGNSSVVVLVSSQPALAACLVNRQEKVRGLVVRKTAEIQEAKQMQANVLVLPEQGLSFAEGLQIFRAAFTFGKGA